MLRLRSETEGAHGADAQRSLIRILCVGLLSVAFLSGCGTKPQASPGEPDPDPIQKSESKPPTVQKTSEDLRAPAVSEAVPEKSERPSSIEASSPSPRTIYRPSDDRPQRDQAALAEFGIHRYASKHLELYTDIEPEIAKDLPKLADQLYRALEEYFGPLPPDREGSTFQMTGYIMADPRVFRETGLLPENLPGFDHGRHRGAEFWMNDQKYDYYRRHLMLHEATHSFMTITKQQNLLPPVWYMEGMAELFGTHHIADDGSATFRVMPDDKETYAGSGRITLVQTAVKAGRFRSLDEVLELTANDYSNNEAYAWSWALCKFLDTHPRYGEAFRKLGAAATHRVFLHEFVEAFGGELDDLRTEWALFAHDLGYGYQIVPAAITFATGMPLSKTNPSASIPIKADRGWQSTGVFVEQGKKYTLTAEGRFTLAKSPKPWVSEAEGISFRYFRGQPLGRLLGCVRTKTPASIATAQSMRQVFSAGGRHTFIASETGTLYLRLNDDWSQIRDNSGSVAVEVHLE